MKVWRITDDVGYGGHLLYRLVNNAKDLPEPLPWIDPSINCLYKEAVLSFLVGNYEASLSALCMLLEHVLRAAIINDEDTGMNRTDSASQLNKYEWSIGNLQYSFENAYGSLGKKHNK